MITGDPIRDDIQWLLQELKQVDEDLENVRKYREFLERGNTVSTRYAAIDEEAEVSWELPRYLDRQLGILHAAREAILYELECLDESYLEPKYF